MNTPEEWEHCGQQLFEDLYSVNQSHYKEYCEIDKFVEYVLDYHSQHRDLMKGLVSAYAGYVERETNFRDFNAEWSQQNKEREEKQKHDN